MTPTPMLPSVPATPAPEVFVAWYPPVNDSHPFTMILRVGECSSFLMQVRNLLNRTESATVVIQDPPASVNTTFSQAEFALAPDSTVNATATLCARSVERATLATVALRLVVEPLANVASTSEGVCALPQRADLADCFPTVTTAAPTTVTH